MYSSLAMVRGAVSGLFDDNPPNVPTNTAADLSNQTLTDAIAEADSTIDSYIGGRYSTPVAPVDGATPHPIDYWSRNIAAYNATLTQRGGLDFTDQDPIARRWQATMDALNAVASGKATLPLPGTTGDGAGTGAGDAINSYPHELFTPCDFGVFTGDPRGHTTINVLDSPGGWDPWARS